MNVFECERCEQLGKLLSDVVNRVSVALRLSFPIWAGITHTLQNQPDTRQGYAHEVFPSAQLSIALPPTIDLKTTFLSTNKLFSLMSQSRVAASESSYNFQLVINNALKAYEKRTKENLFLHPLASQLQSCESPGDIIAVLQQQILHESRSTDERCTKWLDPTINVLLTFSQTVGTVGLAFSPATVIFAGIGVLLSTAKDVRASQDTLVNIFERIEMFFRRLEVYIEVPATTEMVDIITQIMVEVLCILGIATKEIKQSRIKKYGKKLIGRTDLEDALKKLDKLTQEEARMAIAENLKATHRVDDRVRGVANTVVAIDNRVAVVDDRVVRVDDRVAGVDDRVARVDDRVARVDDRVARVDDRVATATHVIDDRVRGVSEQVLVVDNKVAEVINDGKEANKVIKQTANDVDQVKQNQLRDNIHKWLSPPDPSTNHNIACGTHHKKAATWFFQGAFFREWKSTGSLLWIHGKPGSGKSILSSTIIQDIKALCEAGEASMAYFYFDFRNANKQGLRDLLLSLLTQLSARSSVCCDILFELYSVHSNGKEQPSDSDLTKCLKDMVTLPDQHPVYLILDALDESPNTSGIPSPRERVLQLLQELVNLRIPNLHICVTSRPEVDIQDVITPLTSLRVSLHDQSGQKDDIVDYVRSIVYSNLEPIVRRWKKEDKDLVIEVLSERADGMFRWVFCQLEILRQCLPSSVKRFLEELPESLDETYERMLREIKKPNRDHAQRVMQCLVVAIRPLRVEELAEVLAVDFDDAEGVPKLKPDWRWEDQEQALLASCSSLIIIVDTGHSRVVQFSHYSVKEYLTSARLATSSQDVSRYHIALEPAHAILAQACVSVLLRLPDRHEQEHDDEQDDGGEEDDSDKSEAFKGKDFVVNNAPLAKYAAEYWVHHAQFEDVASRIKGMEYLFDSEKPYFAAWRHLHDIDHFDAYNSIFPGIYYTWGSIKQAPLYYAALCGFRNLVEQLIIKYPQHVNAICGRFGTPALAALGGRHFELAQVLYRSGSSVDPRDNDGDSPLCNAVYVGHLEMVQVLLDYGAEVNSRSKRGDTPLAFAARGNFKDPRVVRLLLDHGADPNAQYQRLGRRTLLHEASRRGRIEVACLLLERGASLEVQDENGETPLHVASGVRRDEMIKLLLEHRAK